jgi:septal ring factor EnvC (AmiA/AmiB activator)
VNPRRGARRGCVLAGIALLLMLAPAVAASQSTDPAAERQALDRLEKIRAEIREVSRVQTELAGEHEAATRQVREADRAIAKQTRALTEVEAEVAAQQARLQTLEAERQRVAAGLDAQRESLAGLLRFAHAQGAQAPLRLLLSQDRLRDASRALAYQHYVQRAQVQRIRNLLDELAALARATSAVETQRGELESALARERDSLAALESRRADRRALLEALAGQQQAQAQKLAELRRDEQALNRLLESLRDIFADIPKGAEAGRPFADLRGSLPMPVAGKVLTAFAGTLPDGRNSEGWLLEAAAGTDVRAVAAGRVAFADWMKGYGLLTIVDHGDGFLSLYAFNDALLREVGDWVSAGEALARAGSSGGQGAPGLYFELRRQGRPLDPKAWLRR